MSLYSVTVQINVEDEEDSLSANESVTVVFGMKEEEIKQLQQRQSMQRCHQKSKKKIKGDRRSHEIEKDHILKN